MEEIASYRSLRAVNSTHFEGEAHAYEDDGVCAAGFWDRALLDELPSESEQIWVMKQTEVRSIDRHR